MQSSLRLLLANANTAKCQTSKSVVLRTAAVAVVVDLVVVATSLVEDNAANSVTAMTVVHVEIVIPAHHSVTVTTVAHAAIAMSVRRSVTVTTVQHALAAETSVAAMTAHLVATATIVRRSVTVTTAAVDHALVATSAAATTVQYVVAMTAHAAHDLIHAEAAQLALVALPHEAHRMVAKNQRAVTSPLVQSVRLDQ
jgi:hypothetical protein